MMGISIFLQVLYGRPTGRLLHEAQRHRAKFSLHTNSDDTRRCLLTNSPTVVFLCGKTNVRSSPELTTVSMKRLPSD